VISAATCFEQARHGRLTGPGRIPLDVDTVFAEA
jgi:hypothetical protein